MRLSPTRTQSLRVLIAAVVLAGVARAARADGAPNRDLEGSPAFAFLTDSNSSETVAQASPNPKATQAQERQLVLKPCPNPRFRRQSRLAPLMLRRSRKRPRRQLPRPIQCHPYLGATPSGRTPGRHAQHVRRSF